MLSSLLTLLKRLDLESGEPSRTYYVTAVKKYPGMASVHFLERRNGTYPRRASARRENYFCQSYCLGSVQRGHDPNSGLQHEKDNKGKGHHQTLGHRRSTKVSLDMGEILQGRQCHRLHGRQR